MQGLKKLQDKLCFILKNKEKQYVLHSNGSALSEFQSMDWSGLVQITVASTSKGTHAESFKVEPSGMRNK